jgi:hypothetical protein
MNKTKFLISALIVVFGAGLAVAPAGATYTSDAPTSVVSSITLQATGNPGEVKWSLDGNSSKGFKVVWSKNQNPTYPLRDGDKYNYYSNADQRKDTVNAFNGSGTYYVRVCEYLGGKCGKYSNQVTIQLGDKTVNTEPKDEPESTLSNAVNSITLRVGVNGALDWTVDGQSASGFKVVWSKNQNPTYPLRSGDQYHYYSNSDARRDTVRAFNGSGTYYARVCEYLGGKCGKYSNQVTVQLAGEDKPTEVEKPSANSVTAIVLKGEGNNVSWEANGYSAQGFKVVYSKTSGPTYPLRDGDRYDYKSNPNSNSDFISPYFGAGTYYVRVCEYLGGKCGVYSNEISIVLGSPESKPVLEMNKIRENADNLYNNKIDQLLAEIKTLRDMVKEQQTQITHLMRLKQGLAQTISSAIESALKNFIAYGVDDNTKKLGEGERAAVIYSFKEAYNKLPETQDEIEEAIKIANGRFPSIVSDEAEANAKAQFKKIYLRDADMSDAHDIAAIKVMAYGLRQKAENRNLKSEAAALKTFKNIFKKLPSSTEEWNALQAITYSGATR